MRICYQVLTSLAKIDLDTWAHLLEERKAQVIVAAFAAALAGARLPPELDEQVRTDFARRLRAIPAAEDGEDRALAGTLLPPGRPRT